MPLRWQRPISTSGAPKSTATSFLKMLFRRGRLGVVGVAKWCGRGKVYG
jgi:hypothetical protein